MAVGFLCKDGVAIGADRQVTGANYTFPECKLSTANWKNGSAIWAYSGERDTHLEFDKEIFSRFWREETITPEQVKPHLQDSLKSSLRKKEVFHTLFGYLLDGEYPVLLMGTASDRVLVVRECEVIGYGDSPLARFLIGRYTDMPFSLTVQQARMYIVYFISQAKKYDGQFVGGPIDVWTVDQSGDNGARCTRILDAGQTPAWEQEINLFQYKMDVLFHRLTDASEKSFDRSAVMNEFSTAMERFSNWTGRK